MARPTAITTLQHVSFADIGSRQKKAAARRALGVLGLGTPIPGTAGAGAAGVALSIIDLADKDVRIECAGGCLVRFQQAAGDVVTAATWHYAIEGGEGRTVHVSPEWTHVSAWGLAGAWNFVIYAVDGS